MRLLLAAALLLLSVSAAAAHRSEERNMSLVGQTIIQTNNVEVDDRGFIYMTDRNKTGMHILELTGAARKIANFNTEAR